MKFPSAGFAAGVLTLVGAFNVLSAVESKGSAEVCQQKLAQNVACTADEAKSYGEYKAAKNGATGLGAGLALFVAAGGLRRKQAAAAPKA